MWDSNGNNIWQIPGNNSNSNGFSSSITSITWDVDPTNSGDLPSESCLNGSSTYYWQIQASDTNGDSAQVQVNFQTATTPLSLPTAGSLGSTVVGQSYSGAINASGGVGPNYTFAVNGTSIPTDGSQNIIADGIWVSSTGGNTLSIGGTSQRGSNGDINQRYGDGQRERHGRPGHVHDHRELSVAALDPNDDNAGRDRELVV